MFYTLFQGFLAIQKENAALWLPILIGVGVGLYFSLGFEPDWWIGAGVLLSSLIAIGALLWRFHQVTMGVLLLAVVLLIALGWSGAQLRTAMVAAPILQKPLSAIWVEGTIRSLDKLDGGRGSRVVLHKLAIERLSADQTPGAIRLSVRRDEGLRPGQKIRLLAGLNPPAAPVAPGSYDFQRHAYFKGLGGYGFAYKAPEILETPRHGGLERFRQKGAERVDSIVPAPEASIVSALLLGERAAIPEDSWEDIRAAGLAHVISISGLHISMIAMGIFFVVRFIMALFPRFAVYHPIKKYAALIALIGAVAYSVMVGLSVPTLRSVMMTGLILTAIMLDRSPFSMRLVAFSAFIILLMTPEEMMGPSFQMSFAAVAALIFFYDTTRNYWSNQAKKGGWVRRIVLVLWGTCLTSVIATIATAPFSLYHFQQFPIYSVIGNVAAFPVIAFVIMPAAVLAYLLMPFGLDPIAIWLMGKGVSGMLWISSEIASWNYASLDLVTWPLASLIAFVAAGLWGMVVKGRMRWGAVLPFIAAIAFIVSYRPPDILVSSSAKLAMIQPDHNTAWLSNLRAEKFLAENWLRAGGLASKGGQKFPVEGRVEQSGTSLSCDPYGCLADFQREGFESRRKIALSFDQRTIGEDCANGAELIISFPPAPGYLCPNSIIIDRWRLREKGAHAIWVEKDGVHIKTVADERGTRPWTAAGSKR